MVHYLTCPQFSSFFGFRDERGKGVTYHVWRCEVDSVIHENLHSLEVIAEQIRKSLKGKLKRRPKLSRVEFRDVRGRSRIYRDRSRIYRVEFPDFQVGKTKDFSRD